jgi:hypothetical protein
MPWWRSRAARSGLLVVLALAVAWMRWHTYAEPRERDLDIYAWIGHYLLQGRHLYTDLVDIKPPLPYLLYALSEALAGFGAAQVYLLGVVSAWATLFGLYWLGARALGRPWIGMAAAVCWVLLGSDLYLQANQPNTEVFINAFLVWAVALLWSLPGARLNAAQCIGIGLLFGCASLCKTVAIVPAALLLLAQFVFADSGSRLRVLQQVLIVAVTSAALWLLVFIWLGFQGSVASAWQILFDYPLDYARLAGAGLIGNILIAFGGDHFMPNFFVVQAWLVLACAAIALAQLQGEERPLATRMLIWMAGIFLAVALPGHAYPHYFQLWLPWLCIALALTMAWIAAAIVRARVAVMNALLIGFVAAWSVLWLWPQYQLSAIQWSEAKYERQFVDSEALGRELRAQLKPEQRLFVFGVFPGLYAAAGREPSSGVLNLWLALPNYGAGLSPALSRRVLDELQRRPPDMIVLDGWTWQLAGNGEPIREWIKAHYQIIGDRYEYSLAVPAPAKPAEKP